MVLRSFVLVGRSEATAVILTVVSFQVFNHNHKSYEKKLMDFTGDEGFDVIIEHLANINLAHDIQMIKKSEYFSFQRTWFSDCACFRREVL